MMKSVVCLLLALVMCISLCGCDSGENVIEAISSGVGGLVADTVGEQGQVRQEKDDEDAPAVPVETEAPAEEAVAEEELERVLTAVDTVLQSEQFARWEALYKEFTGSGFYRAPEVTDVTHYTIADFDGVEMDCYLVAVSANIAHWVNEAAQEGSVDGGLVLFIDAATGNCYDSISTDAVNVQHDTATELGRATYLMWIHSNLMDGSYAGSYLNTTETAEPWSREALNLLNEALN